MMEIGREIEDKKGMDWVIGRWEGEDGEGNGRR
jgi:hypothetical protein